MLSGFRVRDVALIIRCSKRTIERQMNELGLRNEQGLRNELDCKIANFLIL